MNQTLYSLLTLYINQYYKFQTICSLKQGVKIDCCSSFRVLAVIKYPYKKPHRNSSFCRLPVPGDNLPLSRSQDRHCKPLVTSHPAKSRGKDTREPFLPAYAQGPFFIFIYSLGCQAQILPTAGWVFLHQLIIKITPSLPTDMTTGQDNVGSLPR